MEARDPATRRTADAGFDAADAEIHLVHVAGPVVRPMEPGLLGLLGCEGGEDAAGALPEMAADREIRVGDGALFHGFSPFSASSASRNAPRRSRRFSQPMRRSLSHFSTRLSELVSIGQVRVRRIVSGFSVPACSSP